MPDLESVLSGLNEAQREAATALRGPVAILAGAGTGKTTTITHRIACQVRGGAFEPSQILAVTFTDKAAGELRTRLAALGVEGVEARTFHSAALSQLSRLWTAHTGEPLPQILDHKAPVISSLANALPPPHKFLPRRELAGEIEWAKNRMIPPERYLGALGDHEPPIPADLMHRVYDGYERRKASMGRLDFEDMLGLALRLFDEHPEAAEQVRSRFAAFTVDEYQDVNPLQAGLLERWLGDRDDLCVVGDDYQTIYAFTGASPSHLLGFTTRYPHATVVRLEENYRSTPEVLELANRLATRLGGFRKTLAATWPSGPPPLARGQADEEAEVGAVVQAVRSCARQGGRAARGDRGAVPDQRALGAVRGGVRGRGDPVPGARRRVPAAARPALGAAAAQARWRFGGRGRRRDHRRARVRPRRPRPTPTRRSRASPTSGGCGRWRSEFERAHPEGDAAAFGAELAERFSTERSGRGVNLLTYHRAKGLEFDAVFLPRLLDGELPFRSGRAKADPEEERRLLYVGITRARTYLFLTWPSAGRAQPSPFLDEMELASSAPSRAKAAPGPAVTVGRGGAVFDRLKEWRRKRAQADGVPAYVVFHDRTLAEIAERRCKDWADLAAISGVGPAKLERYADEVLAVVSAG